MSVRPEPPDGRRLGPLLAGTLLYVLFAPIGLVVLPLGMLLLFSNPTGRRERIALLGSAFFAIWWLLGVGEAPEQTVRAAALIGAVAYATMTVTSKISTTHKGLLASLLGVTGVTIGYLTSGVSWAEISWLVQQRIGFITRQILGRMWSSPDELPNSTILMLGEAEQIFAGMARFVGANYAGLLTIEMLIGFAIATALYNRVSDAPQGVANGSLKNFTFTEHLGWMAILGLVGLLLPKIAAVKAVAGNLALVAAAIYGLRGVAVLSFAMSATGGSVLLAIIIGIAFVFMLPVMAGGAIVIGILDTGLNIRKRWIKPPARG